MNIFARFDEMPVMTLQDIKKGSVYLQLTVNSQKTSKWLFTVDCQ